MTQEQIRAELFRLRDESYKVFQGALIPTVKQEDMIGVRTPALRALAKEIAREKEGESFLAELPHRYFEENQLHAFLISEIIDFERCVSEVDRFLPFVNNWATCDQMSPRVFRKHKRELLPHIRRWLASEKTYVLRFAIRMLMDHFLDAEFDPDYLSWVAAVDSEDYYVKMMIAWYFATALAKQYSQTVSYIKDKRLAPWTHNKAIRKAIESYRVSPERKEILRRMTIPMGRKGEK